MNISQIPKDYRIYPCFNGEYIGHVIEGYASIETAKRKLKNSLIYETSIERTIMSEYYGNNFNYNRKHTIFYALSDKPCYIMDNTRAGVFSIGEQIHVDDLNLTDDEYKEITKAIYDIRLISYKAFDKKFDAYYDFQKEYKLFPYYNIDYAQYYKDREDFINNKVEYREGKLDICVHWKDTDTIDRF